MMVDYLISHQIKVSLFNSVTLFYFEGSPISIIDSTIIKFRSRFQEEGDKPFKDFLNFCLANTESQEFFKLKDFFLNLNENRIQIPNVT